METKSATCPQCGRHKGHQLGCSVLKSELHQKARLRQAEIIVENAKLTGRTVDEVLADVLRGPASTSKPAKENGEASA